MRINKANNIPRKKSCIISVAILRRNFIRGILKSQFRRIVQFVRPVSWKLCSLLFTMPKLFDKLDIYNQPHPQSVLFSFCGLLVFLGAYFGWVEKTGCLYSIAIWQLHQQTGRKKFISRAFEPPVNVFVWSAKNMQNLHASFGWKRRWTPFWMGGCRMNAHDARLCKLTD